MAQKKVTQEKPSGPAADPEAGKTEDSEDEHPRSDSKGKGRGVGKGKVKGKSKNKSKSKDKDKDGAKASERPAPRVAFREARIVESSGTADASPAAAPETEKDADAEVA